MSGAERCGELCVRKVFEHCIATSATPQELCFTRSQIVRCSKGQAASAPRKQCCSCQGWDNNPAYTRARTTFRGGIARTTLRELQS